MHPNAEETAVRAGLDQQQIHFAACCLSVLVLEVGRKKHRFTIEKGFEKQRATTNC
jgi:hypothetical protein